MKDNIENSWAPDPELEPLPTAQQASILPLDHNNDPKNLPTEID